ncbi:MAG: response regulator transcription factor [Opitutaceae bacterium]|jgi:two-component system response regulator NreC
MKLLIIEDQAMIRQLLLMACRQACPEAELFDAATGADGVEQCRQIKPDIVLLDIMLPDCDGLSLVPKMRAIVSDLKVLVLSAHSDEYTMSRIKASRVNGFVDKGAQALSVLKEALTAVSQGQEYFCSVTMAIYDRMKADPFSFDKILSDREIELLSLFARGLSNQEIGERLSLKPNTVRNHRQNIMGKLGLTSTPQLIHYALEKGFLWSGHEGR